MIENYVETQHLRRNARAAEKMTMEDQFDRVRQAILGALKPYDEARRAVAEALVLLDC